MVVGSYLSQATSKNLQILDCGPDATTAAMEAPGVDNSGEPQRTETARRQAAPEESYLETEGKNEFSR
jgi:hypothetical protein